MRQAREFCWRCRRGAGFTIVEAALSMVVLGILLAAALNAAAAARRGELVYAGRGIGHMLAQELIAEMMPLPFENPEGAPGSSIGPSAPEIAAGVRSAFNDFDDFDGWTESPPRHKDGSVMTGYDGWSRKVEIKFVNPANPNQTQAGYSGVKRVKVTVARGSLVTVELYALRSAAGVYLSP